VDNSPVTQKKEKKKKKPLASKPQEGSAVCKNRPAFFCSIQYVQQSSVLLARAFSQKTRSSLVEQALLSVEAKLVQPASPCFQCNHLQVPENLPEWLLFDFDLDGRQRQR